MERTRVVRVGALVGGGGYSAVFYRERDRIMRLLAAIALFLSLSLPFAAFAQHAGHAATPYAGEEQRDIKALSVEEVEAYRQGKGMGLAKAAELNHYPGPAHVLAMASELSLTPQQKAATEALFASMESKAVQLGSQILEAEQQLDRAFAARRITKAMLHASLTDIASLQGRVREVHLETHLAQAEILSAEQIRKYDELRGYLTDSAGGQHPHAK